MKRPRKTPRRDQLLDIELTPITDPAEQAALDRVFRDEKISQEDRRILKQLVKPKRHDRSR
ncbi:MAG: hypothetical protein FJ271_24775 [Planctomycetes bacterium]|nr:hypothetical protein [Planctomycetota bacterium]